MLSNPARRLLAATLATFMAGAVSFRAGAQVPADPLGSDPRRLAEMQYHFVEVARIQEALVRGDLDAMRADARELSELPMPWGVPASASARVGVIRDAGRRLMTTTSVADAADQLAIALGVCGDCHQSLGIEPALSSAARPDVGGIVGHMLEHERAMDELLQGVVIPSAARWHTGARRLQTAPLMNSSLPPDRGLTKAVRSAETRVHELANAAVAASTLERRAAVYGRLLATCSSCHVLHARIWGPTTKGPQ